MAIAAGRRLADRLFGGPKFSTTKLSYENIPSVVFAHPEIGAIGLTEPEARKKYGDENIKIYKSSFVAMYYAMLDTKGPTSYKLICEGLNGKSTPPSRFFVLSVMRADFRTNCWNAHYWDWKF